MSGSRWQPVGRESPSWHRPGFRPGRQRGLMRPIKWALPALVLTILPLAAAVRNPVKVTGGLVTGVPGRNSSVTAFEGIPFAAPPVGERRWQAPAPVIAWKGVRNADAFGASCIQTIVSEQKPWTYEFMTHNEISEDCLYLNVWTAAKSAKERRPVFFYIYGGAF